MQLTNLMQFDVYLYMYSFVTAYALYQWAKEDARLTSLADLRTQHSIDSSRSNRAKGSVVVLIL